MYPLKFAPIVKPKIWGGEEWLLSGYGSDVSVVANGYLAGNTLDELIDVYMDELVGQHVFDKYGMIFPLLFKRIYAHDLLSVQVHPNDEQAEAAGHDELGKAEMWYVTEAERNAKILLGFAQKTTPAAVRQAIKDNNLEDMLNHVSVVKGDVAYLYPGTIHALCGGTEVLEIQESSDLTYRLYDYGRRDAEGQTRPLHVDAAIDVLNYKRELQPLVDYEPQEDDVVRLVSDDHFTTNIIILTHSAERDYAPIDSFVVLLAADGAFTVEADGEVVRCDKKSCILLPASTTDVLIRPEDEQCRILEVYVP